MTAYDIGDSFWWVPSHQRVGPMTAYDIKDSFWWACHLHGCGCLLQLSWLLLWKPTLLQAASCRLSMVDYLWYSDQMTTEQSVPGNCSVQDISWLIGSRIASYENIITWGWMLISCMHHAISAMLPIHQAGLLSQRLPHNVHLDKGGLLDLTTLDTPNTLLTLAWFHYCVNIH